MRKNAQVVAILMKTGLNNVLLPTFRVVNNIGQYCYTRFRFNNIVQYCWQVWTTWAAKHCSILLSSGLGVFLPCRLDTRDLQHYTLIYFKWQWVIPEKIHTPPPTEEIENNSLPPSDILEWFVLPPLRTSKPKITPLPFGHPLFLKFSKGYLAVWNVTEN
jgi:hypothetical protein